MADDALWAFESVRTIEDAVYEAIEEATIWAVDKPMTKQLLKDMEDRVNQFFRFGVSQGFLVGGRCWIEAEDNPPAQMQSGVIAFRIDPEAVAAMEHIIYYASRNANYYQDELASLTAFIQTQQGA
jgi:uncharacterized protein